MGVPDAPGWLPADRLARNPDRLRAALERAGASLGTARVDIGATRLCEVWTWNLAAPAAAALLIDARLPDLRAGNGPAAARRRVGGLAGGPAPGPLPRAARRSRRPSSRRGRGRR
ncbi:MAG: hypothetical protein M3459_02420 [Actinomycetota bacterium]|nr:hypothetical protein [Actinomycetota bacterium]